MHSFDFRYMKLKLSLWGNTVIVLAETDQDKNTRILEIVKPFSLRYKSDTRNQSGHIHIISISLFFWFACVAAHF